jgi:NAD(P)H dehydrogenase (quinone)
MSIGITGANGHLGRLVVRALRAKVPTADVVALVRTPAKAQDLGVTVREADYGRPGTLAAALKGIDNLLLISGNEIGQRAAQHRNVIAAAKEAGVRRITYTSLLHADRSPLSLAPEHLETERTLQTSGLPFTILRNSWYTENYTNSIKGALATGALIGSAGEGRISAAARADYADAAVAVLTTSGHEGKTLELAGDSAFTLGELAAEISRQAGRTIAYRNLPEAEYAATLAKAGLPPALAQVIASWDTGISRGALFDDGGALGRLIGRRTTSLTDLVRQALT